MIGGSARNIEIGNVTTGSQNIKIGNTSNDSEITIGDSIDGSNANKSKLTLGGAFASTESDSFVQIDTKALKVAGDTILVQEEDYLMLLSLSLHLELLNSYLVTVQQVS